MALGDAGDWATAVALTLSVVGLLAAVWKLARAATRLEVAVQALTKQQALSDDRAEKQWEALQAFQRETNAAINELRMAVSKLTWEVAHTKGEITNPGTRPLKGT
jgi:hypothetical protein